MMQDDLTPKARAYAKRKGWRGLSFDEAQSMFERPVARVYRRRNIILVEYVSVLRHPKACKSVWEVWLRGSDRRVAERVFVMSRTRRRPPFEWADRVVHQNMIDSRNRWGNREIL